jgi:hypothetical protein
MKKCFAALRRGLQNHSERSALAMLQSAARTTNPTNFTFYLPRLRLSRART